MKLNQNVFSGNFKKIKTMVSTWIASKTRKIRSLFRLKDKKQKSHVIYEGDCFRGSRYIVESKRNPEVWWDKHNKSS